MKAMNNWNFNHNSNNYNQLAILIPKYQHLYQLLTNNPLLSIKTTIHSYITIFPNAKFIFYNKKTFHIKLTNFFFTKLLTEQPISHNLNTSFTINGIIKSLACKNQNVMAKQNYYLQGHIVSNFQINCKGV